jgi:hypothetical protein
MLSSCRNVIQSRPSTFRSKSFTSIRASSTKEPRRSVDAIADIGPLKSGWEQWQMTEDEVVFLQRIAAKTMLDYQAQQH